MHLQISGCYWIISQAGMSSSSLFRSWCCRRWVECYCQKVNCCSLVSGFAIVLGQTWKPGAVRSSSQPLAPSHMLTHLLSHWVSSWRKTPQRKQNKKINKSILLCWSISLPTMWVVTSTATSTKTGQRGIWLGTAGWQGEKDCPS